MLLVHGITYRPPASAVDEFVNYLECCVNSITREGKSIYLLGDFNVNLLSANDMHCNRFSYLLRTYALYPLIDKPTRVCASSQTLIDNIFTNAICEEFQSGILYTDISETCGSNLAYSCCTSMIFTSKYSLFYS